MASSAPYEWLIGTRYLRSTHRSGFVSFVASMSVIGLALGVAVLIVVLSVLNGFAIPAGDHDLAFAALIGGDLGPRLLPIGSLASLLWYDLLRKHAVTISVGAFVRVGVILTVPTLTVSLGLLWLLSFV